MSGVRHQLGSSGGGQAIGPPVALSSEIAISTVALEPTSARQVSVVLGGGAGGMGGGGEGEGGGGGSEGGCAGGGEGEIWRTMVVAGDASEREPVGRKGSAASSCARKAGASFTCVMSVSRCAARVDL